MNSRQQTRDQEPTPRSASHALKKNAGTPDVVPANEETEGATGALETPATPPEMTKDGEPESNREGKDR